PRVGRRAVATRRAAMRRGARQHVGHVGVGTGPRLQIAFAEQQVVGGHRRVARDAHRVGQRARRGQTQPGLQAAGENGGAPLAMFESGAMLMYLAQKAGRFLPAGARAHGEAMQWLFWQIGGHGPMAGQNGHFAAHAPEKVPYAIERYTKETNRLYGVPDRRLAGRDYIVGDDYSIADMACYPWIVPHRSHRQELQQFPQLARWFARIA